MNHGIYDFTNDEDKSRFASSVMAGAVGEAMESMKNMRFAFCSILACLDIMASISVVGEDARMAYDEIDARFEEMRGVFDEAMKSLKVFAGIAKQKMEGKQ